MIYIHPMSLDCPITPVALTIAGSDCSAGAGIQADLKTFQQFAVHGLSAITSIVAETPIEVRLIEPVGIPLLQSQINILKESYPIKAIKTGLLPSRSCIIAVAEMFNDHAIPMVVDPVMVASTGTTLLGEDTASTIGARLLPVATLVTPNIPEAAALLNREIHSTSDLEPAARDIAEKYQISCLVKGGHLPGNDQRVDVLWHQDQAHHFEHPYIDLPDGIHGTGCTLSSAITAGLAQGQDTETSVSQAIQYVQGLIQKAHLWQHNGHTIRSLGWCS